jgi:hypothetical protein
MSSEIVNNMATGMADMWQLNGSLLLSSRPSCHTLCGIVDFTDAAESVLHIVVASSRPVVPIEQLAQFQQIIHAERRTAA